METKQPEALRLAEWFEGIRGRTWPSCTPQEAAAELRRMHTENETLHVENDTLQAQAQQCGAGAGCCAQAARIKELEAQLEAVGAGGVGPLMAAPAQPLHVAATSCPHEIDKDKIVLHFDSKQPGKNALAQLAARLQAAQAGWCDGCSPDNCGGCATSVAPVPAVQQDAERYRWLREYAIGAYITAQGKGSTAIYLLTKVPALDGIGEETDAAIDAAIAAAPAQPKDGVAFELWRADHMPDATSAEALAEWCTLHSGQPPADLLQVVHRILCDAYSAGRDGKDFDLLTAKSKVAALFSGAQQHPTSQGLAAQYKGK